MTPEAAARGRAASVRAAHARHDATVEDVTWLLSAGTDPAVIAARLGTTTAALSRRFYRHGPRDLAGPFDRARRVTKRATPQVRWGMMGETRTAPVGAGNTTEGLTANLSNQEGGWLQ